MNAAIRPVLSPTAEIVWDGVIRAYNASVFSLFIFSARMLWARPRFDRYQAAYTYYLNGKIGFRYRASSASPESDKSHPEVHRSVSLTLRRRAATRLASREDGPFCTSPLLGVDLAAVDTIPPFGMVWSSISHTRRHPSA